MELYEYQKAGVIQLKEGSLILADDMGLGKTVQAVVALRLLNPSRASIICPLGMINTWLDELDTWWPDHGFSRFSKVALNNSSRIITNYENVLTVTTSEILICDEAHRLKNRKSLRACIIMGLSRKARITWLLTGTPIMNRADEIWPLLNMVNPIAFRSYWDFVTKWCAMKESRWTKTGIEILPGIAEGKEAAFAHMLEDFLLRRTKSEVGLQLPTVTRQIINLDMTISQRNLYREIMHKLLVEIDEGNVLTVANVLARSMHARRCCDSPRLFGHDDQGCKFPALVDILTSTPDKVVVFSQWVMPLQKFQETSGIPSYLLHGDLTAAERSELLTKWRCDPTNAPLLATLGTGGTGLTLTESHIAIFLDEPWNPAVIEQGIGRLDRIGQTRPVTILTLRCRASIEDTVARTLARKGSMSEGVNAEIERIRHEAMAHNEHKKSHELRKEKAKNDNSRASSREP